MEIVSEKGREGQENVFFVCLKTLGYAGTSVWSAWVVFTLSPNKHTLRDGALCMRNVDMDRKKEGNGEKSETERESDWLMSVLVGVCQCVHVCQCLHVC